MSDITVHHCPLLPFSEKIHAAVGLKNFTWKSVKQNRLPNRLVLCHVEGSYWCIQVVPASVVPLASSGDSDVTEMVAKASSWVNHALGRNRIAPSRHDDRCGDFVVRFRRLYTQ